MSQQEPDLPQSKFMRNYLDNMDGVLNALINDRIRRMINEEGVEGNSIVTTFRDNDDSTRTICIGYKDEGIHFINFSLETGNIRRYGK